MMTKGRTQIIDEVTFHLEEAGFDVSSPCDVKPSCFDIAARKGDQLVLIKALSNVDSFQKEDALALQLVAHFFNAVPLIIGSKTRRGQLEQGVIYARHGVSTITAPSFESLVVKNNMPHEFVQRGGRFVSINGAKMKKIRLSREMSKEELAGCIHVSARAILAYERNEMDISSNVAEKLEQVLETDLIIPVDILGGAFSQRESFQQKTPTELPSLETRVNEFFEKLGMKIIWTDRAPFHVAAKEEGPPLISTVGSLRGPQTEKDPVRFLSLKRVEILRSVSKVTESDAVIIVEEGSADESIAALPVIRQLELDEIEKPQELRKIIEERSDH
ncbi:MAG: transcriptional regulator [Candidatus Thorarchaeota archaeon]|nr:transcriptional regulator [Candidatus Thorarchaeota archaeon]